MALTVLGFCILLKSAIDVEVKSWECSVHLVPRKRRFYRSADL